MGVKPIDAFSESEWRQLESLSPAIQRYRALLSQNPSEPRDQLRLERYRSWIACAGATLLKSSTPRDICETWSRCADELLKKAWSAVGLDNAPIALFALGKLGSLELNLSSDVDVVVLSEHPPDQEIIQKVRSFVQYVSAITDFGFALRIDFDLRPGGRFGPTITSLSQAEDYYWTQGATWERIALVRLRPVCGSKTVIQTFQELARKFSFRRHIDFSLLEDMKKLRSQIHALNSSTATSMNLKLGAGGIRDIELFAHSLLILHGGRRTDLITHRTDDLYDNLIAAAVFETANLQALKDDYWFYRQLENEVQAVNDEQTHTLHFEQNESLKSVIAAKTKAVDGIVSELLGPARTGRMGLQDLAQQKEWLQKLGFSASIQNEVWPAILSLTAQSTRSQFDEEMRREFLFQFVDNLAEIGIDRDLGLRIVLDFLKATRAKASLYSLFVSSPRVIRDLARLFSISPYLGQILISRPELMDSFLYGTLPAPPQNLEALLEYLTEKKLLSEIFGALEILEQPNSESSGEHLSQSADDIVTLLLKQLIAEYGSQPISLLALGKWGGAELGLRSDLDFVFVIENDVTPQDQKVAKRFISRLTEPHKGGMIFQIDLRLRPSGKAGPIMVKRDQLLEYLKTQAAAWERQSYLRSRRVNSDSDFAVAIREACLVKGISSTDIEELSQIRQQLIQTSDSHLDLKYNPGGLIEIEFAAQVFCLANNVLPSGPSTRELYLSIAKAHPALQSVAQNLMSAYQQLRQIEQLLTVASGSSSSQLTLGSEACYRLAQIVKKSETEMYEELTDTLRSAAAWVKQLDPIFTPR